MEQIIAFFSNPTLIALAPFLIIAIFMGGLLYYAHKSSDSKFNVYDTLIDPVTKKASIERISMWTALLSTTWWFLDGVVRNSLGWEGMLAYAGALGLTKIISDLIKAKYKGDQSGN